MSVPCNMDHYRYYRARDLWPWLRWGLTSLWISMAALATFISSVSGSTEYRAVLCSFLLPLYFTCTETIWRNSCSQWPESTDVHQQDTHPLWPSSVTCVPDSAAPPPLWRVVSPESQEDDGTDSSAPPSCWPPYTWPKTLHRHTHHRSHLTVLQS